MSFLEASVEVVHLLSRDPPVLADRAVDTLLAVVDDPIAVDDAELESGGPWKRRRRWRGWEHLLLPLLDGHKLGLLLLQAGGGGELFILIHVCCIHDDAQRDS